MTKAVTDPFWAKVLEPGETLLWAGRAKPRLSLRNFHLLGPFIGAGGTIVAGAMLLTYNDLPVSQSVILAAIIALVVLSVVKGTRRWTDVSRNRYALTDRRALFFRRQNGETRVKAFSRAAETKPDVRHTSPPSVFFIRQEPAGDTAPVAHLGFEYIVDSDSLSALLASRYKGENS